MRKIIALSFMSILLCCSHERSNMQSPLSSSEIALLSKADKFDSIFKKISEIQLSTGANHAISNITDMEIDAGGNYLIADGWQSGAVFIFSHAGEFIKELGKQGQGPGEYLTPVSIDIDSNGDIYVCDYLNNRICVYDSEFQFKRFIKVEGRVRHYIHAIDNGELYMYGGAKLPVGANDFDTIVHYNSKGKKIASFARFPQEVVGVRGTICQEGMTIDREGNLYEMNVFYYHIRKYNSRGKLIKSFSRETKLFSINTEKNENPVIVHGPYYLEKGLIVAQVNRHLEIYDTEGNFLVGELYFPYKIISANKNRIYIEKWSEEDTNMEMLNPKIIGYELQI